jgi:hypothetical protein
MRCARTLLLDDVLDNIPAGAFGVREEEGSATEGWATALLLAARIQLGRDAELTRFSAPIDFVLNDDMLTASGSECEQTCRPAPHVRVCTIIR